MSDLHNLPLVGHDLPGRRPAVRALVFKERRGWVWTYEGVALLHGPFASWREAYDSAHRTAGDL